jgi:hypothetical protein
MMASSGCEVGCPQICGAWINDGGELVFFLGLNLLLLLGDRLGRGKGGLLIFERLQDNTEISRHAIGQIVQPGRHEDQLFARSQIDCGFRQGKVSGGLPAKALGSVGHWYALHAHTQRSSDSIKQA